MRPAKHIRIPDLLYIHSLLGAQFESFHEETYGEQRDLVADYREFIPKEPVEILRENGTILERGQGTYLPRRLRFHGVRKLVCDGLYPHLDELPMDHAARSLRGILSWIPRNETGLFSMFAHGSDEPARLWITSHGCRPEARDGEPEAAAYLRDWSPPPPFRIGIVPEHRRLHQRFGGDPVKVRLGKRTFLRRLFIGGVDYQPEHRPEQVDAVLNVGEEPSRWVKDGTIPPSDRCVVRGEGDQGMSLAELLEEAYWVIDRLQKGERVLLHCVAGMNRSTSVGCAVLILLEGLTAEAALARVREQHAWARPDEHHWLVLQGLARFGPV